MGVVKSRRSRLVWIGDDKTSRLLNRPPIHLIGSVGGWHHGAQYFRVGVIGCNQVRAGALREASRMPRLPPLEILQMALNRSGSSRTTTRTITNDQFHHLRPTPINNRQNAWRCHRSRCRCKYPQISAIKRPRRPRPEHSSLSESRSPTVMDPLAITAAIWKMKGAGARGSKDL